MVRSNGVASRRQILDAAAEIARERGYQGTSISAVSKRSGLPNSSIYWHFENKEALFAAIIDESYAQWRNEFSSGHGDEDGRHGSSFEELFASLGRFPDFLRLGLVMTLERAPEGEGTALDRFFQLRKESLAGFRVALQRDHPHLDRLQADALAGLTLSLIDGSFVAAIAGEPIATPRLHSSSIHTLAAAMSSDSTPGLPTAVAT